MILGLSLALFGCAEPPAKGPAEAPPAVAVSYPVEREVTDYADFTARMAAVESVELRARVSGYLDKVNFKAGSLVEKGDVLFEIDPRTYQAELAQALGNVASAEARVNRLEADFARADRLVRTGAVTREEFDRALGDRGEAVASLAALRAAAARVQLDIGFTKVTAPIGGRVSRANVTVGNLVQAGNLISGTLLTTIVSVDPIYAYFDVDEHTVLRVKQLISEGKAMPPDAGIPVWIGLATEDGHPHGGTLNFIDNQINPRTGTLKVRGVFPNKDELLSPGYFARVRVPIGLAHKALLVTERALDTDQGQKIVYVVDGENKVALRPVRLGALHDGLREITEGLRPDERVIVNGLQQVRPGMTAEPQIIQMPGQRASAAHQVAEQKNDRAVARVGHER